MKNFYDIENLIYKKSIYIVSTPIGNIYDISIRALYILKNVDLIISENIKITKNFINFFNIKNNIISLNKFNEKKKIFNIINFLTKNNNAALVSSSGTPLINDPGYLLIKNIIKNNINIFSVPGACAAISAISISGLKTNKFCYEGFIPKKKMEKINLFKLLNYEKRTIIFYESPVRIINTLEIMLDIFDNNRKIVILKEITKFWEKSIRGNIDYVLKYLIKNKNIIKGEITIILEGSKYDKEINNNILIIIKVINTLNKILKVRKSIKLISEITNISKNYLYNLYLKYK